MSDASSSSIYRVGIALGSNLGSRLANLQAARDLLKAIAIPNALFLQSPIYQTEPVACPPDSADFYNSVIEIAFYGGPFDLLDFTQAIEFKLGRTPQPLPNAPRVIDLDLLYFGDLQLHTGLLELPHPRLTSRRFVLQPLAMIRPELVLPGENLTIQQHLADLESTEAQLAIVQAAW